MLDANAIKKLRDEIEMEIKAGATTDEMDEWADSYAFGRRDLVEVIRLLLTELQNSRELLNDGR